MFLIVGLATSTLTISFLPLHSARIISALSIIIILTILCKKRVIIKVPGISVFLVILFFVVYSGALTILSNGSDLMFFKKGVSLLFDGFPCAILISILLLYKNRFNDHFRDAAFYDFCIYYFWFSVIISITVLMSFLNPEFRAIAEGLFPAQGNITDSSHPDYLYRVRGILPATGASASVYFALGVLLGLIAIERLSNGSCFKRLLIVAGFLGLFFAITLNGRTGFVLLLIGLMVFVLYSIYKVLSKYRVNKVILLRVSVFSIVAILTIYFLIYPMFGDSEAVYRLVEDVSTIISSGGSKGTTGELMKMYFLPVSDIDFLFGDVSTFNSNRIPSDVGYIRVLHAVGVIGFIIFYTFWFISYLIILFSSASGRLKVSCFVLVFSMFILELKEPFFLYLYSSVVLMVPISIYCLSPRIESRANNV